MNTTTLLLILPMLFFLPWMFRAKWKHKITWLEMSATFIISAGLTTIVYIAGIYGETADIEIINGEIQSKNRIHDTYMESYSCKCRTKRTGKTTTTTCQTCYRKHYTVEWVFGTNIGKIQVDKLDRTNSGVYSSPDPIKYQQGNVGDPVAKTHLYINYVKAVPDSLFHHINANKHKRLIPTYPETIYDLYKINRVLSVGVPVPDLVEWNQELSVLLKTLGPQKQANVVVVIANTSDQSYLYSLEGSWIGGNKNDIIIVIGSTSYPKIDWVGVSSWTDSQIFKVKLRDSIMALQNIERQQILSLIQQHTLESYIRKEMADFKYLEDQIEPPLWVIILAVILGLVSVGGLSYYFYHNDPFKQ